MGFTPEANTAGPYLVAFGVLLLLALAARAGAYFWGQSRPGARVPLSLGPYEVALLTGHSARVVETALAGLVDSGAVTVKPGQYVTFSAGPRADQQALDVVQRQVLDDLRTKSDILGLARKFARTDTGAQLRRRLVDGGYLLGFPNYRRFKLMVRALIPLVLVTMVLVQLRLGPNVIMMLLNVEVWTSALAWWWCESWLTLTRTRRGNRMKREIRSLVREHRTGKAQLEREKVADRQKVQRLREAISARAGEWNLAPGWVGSAPGIVPFLGWMGYLAERAEHLEPASQRSLGSLLPARKSGPNRRVGWLYRALGALCAVAALLVFWVVDFGWWAIALFVGCCLVGAGLATRGRKHLAVDGREVLRSGQRPPVLYLRSFAHDALLEGASPFRSLMTALGSRSSYIEEIARAVRNFGTLVAIGDPGSRLPGLGPAQIYVGPEPDSGRSGQELQRWQAEVLGLLRGSALVLISAGYSDGLRWEFAQATANVLPERLVVFVPLNRAQYARFRELTEAYFPAGLPADPRTSSTWGKEPVHGLVHFDRDWTPHFVPFRRHALLQLHLGRVAFRLSFRRMRNRLMHALYPVFRSNQVIWSGIEVPVFFGRTSRHLIVGGSSYARAVAVLVVLSIAWASTLGGGR